MSTLGYYSKRTVDKHFCQAKIPSVLYRLPPIPAGNAYYGAVLTFLMFWVQAVSHSPNFFKVQISALQTGNLLPQVHLGFWARHP